MKKAAPQKKPSAKKATSTKNKAAKKPAAKKPAKTAASKQAASAKKARPMKKAAPLSGNASALIDQRIRDLGDWRGATLANVRRLIKAEVPEVLEEWKWRGVPVWSHAGIICTGESYKSVIKLTFAKGAALSDPSRLFNSSLEGNTRRAIDIHENEKINEGALKKLIGAAAALNVQSKKK